MEPLFAEHPEEIPASPMEDPQLPEPDEPNPYDDPEPEPYDSPEPYEDG
ncbi:hypothetical protein BN59_03003 [Legionella massiliensis]|uniref:Uncharacterized protein n=1 Tax=Legionella massiliensis TaxID=1034943 RepID=A0A078L0K4_9GAMM|nr:hypothetical protein [Legionella massiliensis]CDZ78691.1 hypothetical protein BN59_03003 [Legionella massiliensis]CEE14429.1 hypothetical protein BN1094_03003 [Legionella massiliensis]